MTMRCREIMSWWWCMQCNLSCVSNFFSPRDYRVTWLFSKSALLGVNGRLDIGKPCLKEVTWCQEEKRVCYEGIHRPGWKIQAIWYHKGTKKLLWTIFMAMMTVCVTYLWRISFIFVVKVAVATAITARWTCGETLRFRLDISSVWLC